MIHRALLYALLPAAVALELARVALFNLALLPFDLMDQLRRGG